MLSYVLRFSKIFSVNILTLAGERTCPPAVWSLIKWGQSHVANKAASMESLMRNKRTYSVSHGVPHSPKKVVVCYPSHHPFIDRDVPNQPSSYWGTPMDWKLPRVSDMLNHIEIKNHGWDVSHVAFLCDWQRYSHSLGLGGFGLGLETKMIKH